MSPKRQDPRAAQGAGSSLPSFPRRPRFAASVCERHKSDLKKFRAIAQVIVFTLEPQVLAVRG